MRTLQILHSGGSYADAALDAASYLEGTGHRFGLANRAPVLLAYSPVARMNPFQALLYSSGWEHGVCPMGVRTFEELSQCAWPGKRVFHIHWTASVLRDARSADHARHRIDDFRRLLDDLRTDNTRLLWTLHNPLPHDCALPDSERVLRELLAERVDAIHVLSPNSAAATEHLYRLDPAKVFYSPHPSFLGAYPDFVSRHTARFELGLEPDDFVFLFFGSVQRYKGVPELLRAFATVRQRAGRSRKPKLLIAGAPQDDELRAEVESQAEQASPDVGLTLRKVPTEDVQYYFRASDVCVMPYKRLLNSGAVLLAFSFGKPVVAPHAGALRDLLSEENAFLYSAGHQDGLAEALSRALDETGSQRAEGARATAEELRPARASDQFFTALRNCFGDQTAMNGLEPESSSTASSSAPASRNPATLPEHKL